MAKTAHREKVTKYTSLILVSDETKDPVTLKFRSSILKILIGAGITVLVLIVLGAATYWKVAEVALDYSNLEEENFKLRKGLEQIEKIKETVNQVQQYEKKLRGSMEGYVSLNEYSDTDTAQFNEVDFAKLNIQKKKTIFNNIPSLMPVEGFVARGFESSSVLADPHLGVDIAAASGSPIKAPADGVVIFSGWTNEAGYMLIINHGYGFLTVYKHNERNIVTRLERIIKGQVIALLGDTGEISSGPHLHFEVWRDGEPVEPGIYIGYGNKEKS
jgi:murein DD-endopeptidase MepM/ murein hydrolase activator NlpD